MKVYVVRYSCGECGEGFEGLYSTKDVAEQACVDSVHKSAWIDDYDVQDTYTTLNERLREDRIRDSRDPVTGR